MSAPYNFSDPQGMPRHAGEVTHNRSAPQDDFSPSIWASIKSKVEIVVLPSGQKVKVQPLEMEDVIEMNLINELDTFTGFFSEDTGESSGFEMMKKLSEDGPDGFSRFRNTIDLAVMKATVEPRLSRDGANGSFPIANVPFVDKVAIFGTAFQGLGDMGDFRSEQDNGVGTLEEQPGESVSTI